MAHFGIEDRLPSTYLSLNLHNLSAISCYLPYFKFSIQVYLEHIALLSPAGALIFCRLLVIVIPRAQPHVG